MRQVILVGALLAAFIAAYIGIIRRRLLTWGATADEVVRSMPGDSVVRRPHFVATRAVTIDAPPAEVWKWIVQIGSSRAGWYSIDWIDNGGVRSSREILPKYQKIEQGYFIPFTPDQKNGMWVAEFVVPKYILWRDDKGKATWLWHMQELPGGKTRLVTRLRTVYDLGLPWLIYYVLYDAGDIVMMRKCMLGIKERAEAQMDAPDAQ